MRLLVLLTVLAVVALAADTRSASECIYIQRRINEDGNDDDDDDDTEVDGVGVSFFGCHDGPSMGLPSFASDVPDAAPSENATNDCAAACQLEEYLKHSLEYRRVQVVWFNQSCFCVEHKNNALFPSRIPNETDPCQRATGRVYQFNFSCPLNMTHCTAAPHCVKHEGCCMYQEKKGPVLPAFYRAMVQWTAIVIIVLALIESFLYGFLRFRAPRREEEVLLRDKSEALALSKRLTDNMPSSPIHNDDDATCPICLDELQAKRSIILPCHHELHADCLRDYLNHELVRREEVPCPMCRAAIPCSDAPSHPQQPSSDDGSSMLQLPFMNGT